MQKAGPVQPDVDEGRLHSRQHPRDLAQIDIADQSALQAAFDVQLLHRSMGDQRHARFLRGDVDENVFGHRVHGLGNVARVGFGAA
ncbi:hypothetical protein GALL_445890 [mine drainage metagenome]|uniref:Uncharacterized protein n=1 Tax=mine drainage metagenome TaxID=410659 RepID=A0A1J5PQJ4_9ZZZZ